MKGRQPKTEVVRLPTQPIAKHLEQSDDNHSRTCVCVFTLFFCISFFLFGNRNKVQKMEHLSSLRRYECQNHVQHPIPLSLLKFFVRKGSKGLINQYFGTFVKNHKLITETSCICVMYVSRGFYNVSVDERNKIVMGSIWW